MIAPLNKNQLRRSDVSASEISSDIVSLYSNESKTIFLLDDGQARHLLSYPFLCGCAGSACWSRRPPKIRNHRPATLPSCRSWGIGMERRTQPADRLPVGGEVISGALLPMELNCWHCRRK